MFGQSDENQAGEPGTEGQTTWDSRPPATPPVTPEPEPAAGPYTTLPGPSEWVAPEQQPAWPAPNGPAWNADGTPNTGTAINSTPSYGAPEPTAVGPYDTGNTYPANGPGYNPNVNPGYDPSIGYDQNYPQTVYPPGGYVAPGYGAPGYGPGYTQGYGYTPQAAPANYMVWGIMLIVAGVLCDIFFVPFGIVTLVYSNKSTNLWARGYPAEAQEASRKARIWATAGTIVGSAAFVLLVLFFIVVAASTPSGY